MVERKTPLAEFHEQGIEFVAEQDGVSERELKTELRNSFQAVPAIQRAYLAVVRYSGKPDLLVALCVAAHPNSESQFIPRIADIFSKMFNPNQHLDIMLINEAQEMELSKVCRPFFIRASVTPA